MNFGGDDRYCHIKDTSIYLDDFRKPYGTYFLSHAHRDHMRGIGNSWDKGVIHCTEATKAIVQEMFPGMADKYICGHPIDEYCTISVYGTDEQVEVHLIDANHCPGSCMFLLAGWFGKVVYTGDFRFVEHMLENEHLLDFRYADEMFLDNTHQDIREEIPQVEQIVGLSLECFQLYPPATQFRIGVESLGKEEYLLAVGQALGCKVFVSELRLNCLRNAYPDDDRIEGVFTTNSSEARIHTVSRTDVNSRQVAATNLSKATKVVSVLLMGRCVYAQQRFKLFGSENHDNIPRNLRSVEDLLDLKEICKRKGPRYLPNHLLIPYSAHSSQKDLERFVEFMEPGAVNPITARTLSKTLCGYVRPQTKKRQAYLKGERQRVKQAKYEQSLGESSRSQIQSAALSARVVRESRASFTLKTRKTARVVSRWSKNEKCIALALHKIKDPAKRAGLMSVAQTYSRTEEEIVECGKQEF
eukprot:CAMPEP_0203751188 /NCGR_PEP_ID=MMETSP0098-20131031/5300_1 /ASSEMBLY_ACC=CAM_ASM_000208 /TAXON_ID=96639 /ORGANISM=" , Strain NY0313808BC1" /LENGTH=470 /DNA_ID=CAMNT_0050640793 /DNA_START=16 /DNA_END=1425 /DNA_ORIENTATION=-